MEVQRIDYGEIDKFPLTMNRPNSATEDKGAVMSMNTAEAFELLFDKNNRTACKALQELQKVSGETDKAYFIWTDGAICWTAKISIFVQESDMAKLTSMMNIGREMAKKLDSVGIHSAEELVCLGAEQAFLKLKGRYPNVCLVHLYALEGAVCNVEFNSLSESRKRELKEYSDFLKS